MIRHVVSFVLVSPYPPLDKREKAWEKEHLALLKPLGARQKYDDTEVVVTPAHVAELLNLLGQWRKGGARVNGYQYREELIDSEKEPVEWFAVDDRTTHYEAFENWGQILQEPVETLRDYMSVRADRLEPGVHIVAASACGVFVSERFKNFVETHHLTGMDFLWCPDNGKYRVPQWYLSVCSQCLGRGLDAPWIDLGSKPFRKLDPRTRHGETRAYPAAGGKYRPDAGPKDPDVLKLLRLLRSMDLGKGGPEYAFIPRYLRNHLPHTDFAFTMGRLHPEPGLAMNRKAYDLLIAQGLIGNEFCIPLLIVERPPRGVEDLDRSYGPVEPTFSAEQMTRLRGLEKEAWAQHLANPKPPRAPNVDPSSLANGSANRQRRADRPLSACRRRRRPYNPNREARQGMARRACLLRSDRGRAARDAP
jgi:hypothetical protein